MSESVKRDQAIGRGSVTIERVWQNILHRFISGPNVSFTITYRDPTTGKEASTSVEERISIGRDPGGQGLQLSAANPDFTISANALEIVCESDRVWLRNTSSQNNFEVRRLSSGQMTLLLVKDTLEISQDVTIFLAGAVHEHLITIEMGDSATSPPQPLTTVNLVPPDYSLVEDRKEVMSHLCAPILYPHRYSFHENKAPDIANRISRLGINISSREVNNKIQREREKVNELCDLSLSTREELAEFLVEHDFITFADVNRFVLGQ